MKAEHHRARGGPAFGAHARLRGGLRWIMTRPSSRPEAATPRMSNRDRLRPPVASSSTAQFLGTDRVGEIGCGGGKLSYGEHDMSKDRLDVVVLPGCKFGG